MDVSVTQENPTKERNANVDAHVRATFQAAYSMCVSLCVLERKDLIYVMVMRRGFSVSVVATDDGPGFSCYEITLSRKKVVKIYAIVIVMVTCMPLVLTHLQLH